MKDNKITLKLKITNLRKEQAIALVNMFQEMEKFGYAGHSSYIGFYADGDGDFHPKVSHNLKISDSKLQEYKNTTKVYEKNKCIKTGEKRFPWTDSITLFDFDGLVSTFNSKTC